MLLRRASHPPAGSRPAVASRQVRTDAGPWCCARIPGAGRYPGTSSMKLWQDLLSSDVGLMSLAVIVGVLVIGAYLGLFIRRKLRGG